MNENKGNISRKHLITAVNEILETFVSGVVSDRVSDVVDAYQHALLGEYTTDPHFFCLLYLTIDNFHVYVRYAPLSVNTICNNLYYVYITNILLQYT